MSKELKEQIKFERGHKKIESYLENISFLTKIIIVKNDHRSKFSNLSNWKEKAWKKNQGYNGIRTRALRDTGAMLYQLQLSYEATH